jgi:hypothetical protein
VVDVSGTVFSHLKVRTYIKINKKRHYTKAVISKHIKINKVDQTPLHVLLQPYKKK